MARTSGFRDGNLPENAIHVLLALSHPRHGYAIMQFLEEESGGSVIIGPASLYTTLKNLVTAGYIEELDSEEKRRVYAITPMGQEILKQNIDRYRRIVAMAENIMEQK